MIIVFEHSILPVTETSEVVFISTEFLCFCLGFILTETFVDDRPDHIIVLHDEVTDAGDVLCERPLV